MAKFIQNTFTGGLNQDLSDFIREGTMLRGAKNIRIIDLDSSTFAATLVDGTEESFVLSPGFHPLATREYNNTLYIVSLNSDTDTIELGSFPSPNYADPASTDFYKYRPFNNLIDDQGVQTPFRTNVIGYKDEDFVDIVLQPEYDNSINFILIAKGFSMRIVNSKFQKLAPNSRDNTTSEIVYKEIPTRSGNANSNTYTSSSLDKETSLILSSDKILKIDYNTIEDGGQLNYGNYVYLFQYMTEDFNSTDIIGQSSICSVFSGDNVNIIKGDFQTSSANKLVKLNLGGVDTDFRYLKVYFKYSSGSRDALYNAVFEITIPVPITGETMTFIHSGFEETIEVDESVINFDSSIIDSAATGEAIGGYLMLGDIVERAYEYEDFKEVASQVTMNELIRTNAAVDGNYYSDAENIYKDLGYFGGETYPWGMVFILPDGKLTPPFPVTGKDMLTNGLENYKGLFRHSNSNNQPAFQGVLDSISQTYKPTINVKHVQFNLDTVDATKLENLKKKSIGFFFVRADRKPDLITQGVLIPTLRVPPIEVRTGNSEPNDTYYWSNADNEEAFRFVPCIDNILEGYRKESDGGFPEGDDRKIGYVVDDRNKIKDGYMPLFINDLKDTAINGGGGGTSIVAIDNYSTQHWAFISGDGLLNNPEHVALLNNRSGIDLKQLCKIEFSVESNITPLYDKDGPANPNTSVPTPISMGSHYLENRVFNYSNNSNKLDTISSIPGNTFASGSKFISKASFDLMYYFLANDSNNRQKFLVEQTYGEYFGITLINNTLVEDGIKAVSNPIGGNTRRTVGYEYWNDLGHRQETSGVAYSNADTKVNAAFLVNLYQSDQRGDIELLYPTLDGVIYRQVGNRYAWGDVSSKVSMSGGDCYISKVTRKINQSGFSNPLTPFDRKNIDAGIGLTWWQESKYNLYLRVPLRYDESETTDRSFYPLEGGGNFESFRHYRLPETVEGNKGYSVTETPKSFIGISELSPSILSSFFTRVHHSARHIPNAFANGYRIFDGLNFKDYDTAMGTIVNILNHRGNMVVVFEHGLAITSIEQRVQTGEDFAGQIFVKPSDILPQTLQFYSREIGCQQPKSIIQTPSAIYGIDSDKHKIWQIKDSLTVITEDGLSSFMAKATFKSPHSGYDFEYNEVLFTTDDWTLCFREGLEKFTSFYTFSPSLYATRSDEFYGFAGGRFHKHNANTKTIYGDIRESYVEFTVNEGISGAKVYDYINIISNDVEPEKIEFFSYSDRTYNEDVISTAKVEQYTKVEQGLDPFTDEDKIRYRDKKFVVQIPNVEIYNKKSTKDEWDKDGRLRNKYIIVRVTYKTEDYLHLIAILTSTRNSFS